MFLGQTVRYQAWVLKRWQARGKEVHKEASSARPCARFRKRRVLTFRLGLFYRVSTINRSQETGFKNNPHISYYPPPKTKKNGKKRKKEMHRRPNTAPVLVKLSLPQKSVCRCGPKRVISSLQVPRDLLSVDRSILQTRFLSIVGQGLIHVSYKGASQNGFKGPPFG